ncbi:hypothetical protein DICSQDRAFT_179910 [Dichomitus squalens LYAD-421 SS1]|uniref:uncharacterized protein n=1 Tax=Dichomitus squalens (strain LYAD-421) TaxID=732165 RepID=UPI0004415B13|nr:uncharacterized protein DICSQDRAFT_179910 [Dichomitus squalens LYAD-421 SS1]EJF62606.1 hypothetical protein DICSQDRAFT_179910 [Dichomitus squalens LYAD-421 SS1]
MEVDMTPVPYRTRSTTKRARSPSSPTQYDRPSKRFSSGHDTSMPFPPSSFHPVATRLRGSPEDWVSQTQDLRLGSPLEQSRVGTPVEVQGEEVRIDEVMVDEPMCENDNSMSISPTRRSSTLLETPQAQYLRPSGGSVYLRSGTTQSFQNPNQLQIPAIHVQAATPSPVQLAPPNILNDDSLPVSGSPFAPAHNLGVPLAPSPLSSMPPDESPHPYTTPGPPKKQRFTMGPRADCEMCRTRVKGHYMHFD